MFWQVLGRRCNDDELISGSVHRKHKLVMVVLIESKIFKFDNYAPEVLFETW